MHICGNSGIHHTDLLKRKSTSVKVMDIRLESPPESPGALLTLDDLPSPGLDDLVKPTGATVYAVISPEKKPRKPSAPRKRRRSLTPCPDHAGELLQDADLSPLAMTWMTNILGNSLTPTVAESSPSFDGSTDGDDYHVYVESVMSFVSGLFQLSETIFIVQGWDRKRESATALYYHLERLVMANEAVVIIDIVSILCSLRSSMGQNTYHP
ncbi:hypothetical protein F5887DRAFT_918312 [Amanita rubescens]|nr:hypothetical protein F5887DRAFT_918312 [Amanita rubescens]